jgi:hypothetical protein
MNYKCIKVFLILLSSLMAQATFSNTVHSADTLSRLPTYREVAGTDANLSGRYALPSTKFNIEPCQHEALRLHPGVIEKQRMLHRRGDFLIRFQIQT